MNMQLINPKKRSDSGVVLYLACVQQKARRQNQWAQFVARLKVKSKCRAQRPAIHERHYWLSFLHFMSLSDAIQSREKMMKGVRRGCVRLKGAVIGIDDQDVNTFTITVDHKTFHFQVREWTWNLIRESHIKNQFSQARDGEEREKWVRHLEDTIARSTHRRGVYYDTSQTLQSMGGSSTSGRLNNHLVVFDRKVSEADAYLQLMIDQTTKIEQRIEAIENADESEKYKPLKEQANVSSTWRAPTSLSIIFSSLSIVIQLMLDHIKHSIVLLQIAKVKVHRA